MSISRKQKGAIRDQTATKRAEKNWAKCKKKMKKKHWWTTKNTFCQQWWQNGFLVSFSIWSERPNGVEDEVKRPQTRSLDPKGALNF